MRIKRLYIGDFGILRNQALDNLSPGMVVVGGCNRAGKSTFMQVLRYLGYGIPQSRQLPSANAEYLVEADVTREDNNTVYHIRLNGHGEPVCTGGDSIRIPLDSLYGLDQFTYHNLFTISLDQLTKVPEGMTGKDVDRLQSALLGAGLADIANIPRLEDKFLKSANAIGGTDGKLTVKGFKPHVQMIREGVRRKKEALDRVDEYNVRQKTLSDLSEREKSIQKEIIELQAKLDILEMLKSNYEPLTELTVLDSILEKHEGACMPDCIKVDNRLAVEEAYKDFNAIKAEWQKQYDELAADFGGREKVGSIVKLLVKHRTSLQSFYDRLSGLKEIWNSLESLQNRLKEQHLQVLDRISRLNSNWNEDSLHTIRELRLDMIEESRLMKAAEDYRDAVGRLNHAKMQLDEARAKSDRLARQVEKWKAYTPLHYFKLYLWAAAASAAAGAALWFINPILGFLLGLFGIVGAALYALFKGIMQRDSIIRRKELEAEIADSKSLQEKLSGDIMLISGKLKVAEDYFSEVRSRLGIPDNMGPDGILEYYRALSDITGRLKWLDSEKKEMVSKSREMTGRITEIAGVLSKFENNTFEKILSEAYKPELTQDTWSEIQASLIKWHSLMEKAVLFDKTAVDLAAATDKLQQISGSLNKSEALAALQVQSAADADSAEPGSCPEKMYMEMSKVESWIGHYFDLCSKRTDYMEKKSRQGMLCLFLERAAAAERTVKAAAILDYRYDSPLELFRQLYNRYPSREFVEREYNQEAERIRSSEIQLEGCREEIHKIKVELEQLSMTEELERSHDMIQQGRAGLFQASCQYAVYKAAAWLCREVKNGFMEKMKDELLRKADGVLSQLTGGDYQRILPKDDLSDFSFVLQDGSLKDNSSILSRGTREQVFLAVRLGRILDIKPALPVIIDDSFVNFDNAHLKQAVDIICRLSQTHQVFIMTCHPHLVGMLTEVSSPVQYWRLDRGHFSVVEGLELMKYLKQDIKQNME